MEYLNQSSYVCFIFYVVLFSESFSHARSLGRGVGHLRSYRKSTERLEFIAERRPKLELLMEKKRGNRSTI